MVIVGHCEVGDIFESFGVAGRGYGTLEIVGVRFGMAIDSAVLESLGAFPGHCGVVAQSFTPLSVQQIDAKTRKIQRHRSGAMLTIEASARLDRQVMMC